jgi:hypothetical protein
MTTDTDHYRALYESERRRADLAERKAKSLQDQLNEVIERWLKVVKERKS